MPYQSRHSSDTPFGSGPTRAGTTRDHGDTLEARLAAMRSHLARTRPASDAEALRMLRAAFPETSLSERVAVLAGVVGPAR